MSRPLFSSNPNTGLNTPRHGPIKPDSLNPETPRPISDHPAKNSFRSIQTPMRSVPVKGLVNTPAHPKAPSFAVFNDNNPPKDIEKENIPPAERMGLADPLDTDFTVSMDPKYKDVFLKDSDEEEKVEEYHFKLPKILEDDEFDMDAFFLEYADVIDELKQVD